MEQNVMEVLERRHKWENWIKKKGGIIELLSITILLFKEIGFLAPYTQGSYWLEKGQTQIPHNTTQYVWKLPKPKDLLKSC